jgi:hypothetical protein
MATMSFLDAAETVLRVHADGKPLHYKQITEIALEKGLVSSEGLTPESTTVAVITSEIKKRAAKGLPQRFRAYGKGLYGLEASSDPAQAAVAKQNLSVRKRLRESLAAVDPEDFEHLIGQLLTAIGFEDVEVTKYSSDGGIDVRGRLVVGGVTNVQTAIQVKRWKNNVQDKVVRELRGGLSTQERGLIITLSDFTSPAYREAEKPDRVPISLLNGEQLIDLLVENEIGVVVRKVNVLELDEGALDPPAVDGGGAGGPLGGGRKVLAIWPLPGGATAWISTLRTMLEKVSADQPTVKGSIAWLMTSFDSVSSEKSARSYWGVPRAMGLARASGERLLLTDLGAEYLNTGSNEWLLQRLREAFVGIDELLERLEGGPATEDELLEYLRAEAGVSWETLAQLKFRLGWLESLGAAHREGKGWARQAQSSGN